MFLSHGASHRLLRRYWHTFLYFVNETCGCCDFLPFCRALCRCQSAFLSTCLVELFSGNIAGTNTCYQQSLVFNLTRCVCNSLIESGPLPAKYGCTPRLQASNMLEKPALLRSAQRATHVDSVLTQQLFLPLLLKTHENIAKGNKSGCGSTSQGT